jgi:death-on-curing protein
MPMATFEGRLPHPTMPAMAAAYLFHLSQNHAFLDGNKRVAANAAITFLPIDDWELECRETELAGIVLAVASGTMSKGTLTAELEARCHPASNPLIP